MNNIKNVNVYTDDLISNMLSDKERKIIAILYQTKNIKYFALGYRKSLELGVYDTPSSFFNKVFKLVKDDLSDYERPEIEKLLRKPD